MKQMQHLQHRPKKTICQQKKITCTSGEKKTEDFCPDSAERSSQNTGSAKVLSISVLSSSFRVKELSL